MTHLFLTGLVTPPLIDYPTNSYSYFLKLVPASVYLQILLFLCLSLFLSPCSNIAFRASFSFLFFPASSCYDCFICPSTNFALHTTPSEAVIVRAPRVHTWESGTPPPGFPTPVTPALVLRSWSVSDVSVFLLLGSDGPLSLKSRRQELRLPHSEVGSNCCFHPQRLFICLIFATLSPL